MTEGGREPVAWGGADRGDVLAEIRTRLEAFGQATVQLDPDAPFDIDHRSFVGEMDGLARVLELPVTSRDGAPPFTRVFSLGAADPGA